MYRCWWLVIPACLFPSLCVAPEPVLSSVASLVSLNTLVTEVIPPGETVAPVSGPITYVPVTATAPIFCGTLAPDDCSALFQPTPSVFSDVSQIVTSSGAVSTGTPDKITEPVEKWPPIRGSLRIPGYRLNLIVYEYGFPMSRDLEKDIVSDLDLLVSEAQKSDPNSVFSATTLRKKWVDFEFNPRMGTDLKNQELAYVLTAIKTLTVSEGPRMIKTGFISRGIILVGEFSLSYNASSASGKPESSQNASISTQV